ncbi:MAG: phosphoribosylamine--glycine ligase [Casimicrobiaceae bacterium]
MNVLVVGGGGREHALAWKLAQSPRVAKVFVAPGNAGTALDPALANVPIESVPALEDFARREAVRLTVVGPEAPLAEGIVDAFRAAGLSIFGPTRAAARLESSKAFAKAFMQRHGIPTAEWRSFDDAGPAHAWVDARGAPVVVKADGLAAGKGVVVAEMPADAHAAIDAMLSGNAVGNAGARVVIEDRLEGEEASFIVMADGRNALALASSQDHKRLADGDHGPNTGGMGAYSPATVVTPTVHARIMREIIQPAIAGMATERMPYSGFLYAGVMIDGAGNPYVLEFNCRMGDPETQPIMVRLASDLGTLIEHALAGTLDAVEADWDRRAALTVVLAAAGYPGSPRTGDLITGLEGIGSGAHPDVVVFHAGTALDGDLVRTSGGRVLGVTALGESIRQAQRSAYAAAASIHFDGMQYRSDIGHRALARHG